MNALRLVPPDGSDWTIDAEAQLDGVTLAIAFPLSGQHMTLRVAMSRDEARALSDGILKAAGDGTQRTFPHPHTEGVGGG